MEFLDSSKFHYPWGSVGRAKSRQREVSLEALDSMVITIALNAYFWECHFGGQRIAERIDVGAAVVLPAGLATRQTVEPFPEFKLVCIKGEVLNRLVGRPVVLNRPMILMDSHLRVLVELLGDYRRDHPVENSVYVKLLFQAIAARVLEAAMREEALSSSSVHRPEVAAVIRAVLDNLGDEHRIDLLASRVGLSSSQLARIFRAQTGESIHQYILRVRLEKARELLATGDLTVAAVAKNLGFYDHTHLARSYKKAFGHAPRRGD